MLSRASAFSAFSAAPSTLSFSFGLAFGHLEWTHLWIAISFSGLTGKRISLVTKLAFALPTGLAFRTVSLVVALLATFEARRLLSL